MAKIAYCIFCDSLEVSESFISNPYGEDKYEYFCYDCGESWSDDESEFEMGL